MILTGALVNGGAIVVGGLLGTFGGKLMPEKMRQTVLGATALVSMGIGISGAIGSSNQLIPILSLVIGAVIGELLHIEDGVTRAEDLSPVENTTERRADKVLTWVYTVDSVEKVKWGHDAV